MHMDKQVMYKTTRNWNRAKEGLLPFEPFKGQSSFWSLQKTKQIFSVFYHRIKTRKNGKCLNCLIIYMII